MASHYSLVSSTGREISTKALFSNPLLQGLRISRLEAGDGILLPDSSSQDNIFLKPERKSNE